MTTTRRLRAVLDIDKKHIPDVIARAQGMHDGMDADHGTYVAPNPPLPDFFSLIQNLVSAQLLVPKGTRGAAATRDVARDLLVTGMESERMYVQILADASPLKAAALIQNAGLGVAGIPMPHKALLTLSLGAQSGSLACEANIGLLLAMGPHRPHQNRFCTWEYTLDGGKTFVAAPPTSTGKTTILNLPPLSMVGVRVNLSTADGPGPWSPVVSVIVH